MKNLQLKKITTKVHFFLLGLGILNFLIKETVEISLNYQIAYIITVLTYISGFILFFWNLRPFKKIAIYFSIYVITPILIINFWLFGGIFLGVLSSVVLYPIQSNELKLSEKNIQVYENENGFLGNCCPHVVTEKHWAIFQREIKEFDLHDEINSNNSSINIQNGRRELKINYDEYEFLEPSTKNKDTIIFLERE